MELKYCKNGHAYDPSITPECPECAALSKKEGTVPLEEYSIALEHSPDYGKTIPLDPNLMGNPMKKTEQVNKQTDHWANHDDYVSGGMVNQRGDSYGPTMQVDYLKQEGAITQPVVGWLVCINGPEKGRDYRIHAQNNYIGRAKNNDICIPGDPTVSRERHAIVAYDLRSRAFYFAPCGGASIVYCNGAPVFNNVQLSQGDRVEIGQCTFMFVPLCGENFQWD